MMRRFGSVLLTVVLVVSGCAVKKDGNDPVSLSERIGSTVLENVQETYNPRPPGTAPQTGSAKFFPVPISQPLPEYPPKAIPSEVACTASLLWHTEMDGSASLVRIEWTTPPPEEHLASFEAAIERAVAVWEFEPAYELIPTEMPDGAIEPVKQTIRWAGRAIVRFMVVDGAGIVAR